MISHRAEAQTMDLLTQKKSEKGGDEIFISCCVDFNQLNGNELPMTDPNLSFAARFAPTENKEFDKLFKCVKPIACLMFPPAPDAKNASIKSPEVKEVRREVLKRRAGSQRDVRDTG